MNLKQEHEMKVHKIPDHHQEEDLIKISLTALKSLLIDMVGIVVSFLILY